jgi:hypothetical protein
MRAFDQSNEQQGDNTMFTKATLVLAVILVTASGALTTAIAANAPQHPRVPSATASTGSDELYNSCHSSHAVFSCPGGGGQ